MPAVSEPATDGDVPQLEEHVGTFGCVVRICIGTFAPTPENSHCPAAARDSLVSSDVPMRIAPELFRNSRFVPSKMYRSVLLIQRFTCPDPPHANPVSVSLANEILGAEQDVPSPN